MEITHKFYEIPEDLSPLIKAIWHVNASGKAGEISPVQCCLPNGLTELIVNLKPQFKHYGELNGARVVFPDAYMVGVMSEPVHWSMDAGTELLGICFTPEAFVSIFNLSISDIADRFERADLFLGGMLGNLINQIRMASHHEQRQRFIVDYFRQRQINNEIRQPYFFQALEQIRLSSDALSLEEICGQVFVGKRQLQRAFQDNLGVSLKTYGRILRFVRVYDSIYKNPNRKLTEIAHQFGYADQSHFIREFREFTGDNPSAFLSDYQLDANMPFVVRN